MDLSTVRFCAGSHSATTAPTGDRDLCIIEAVAYMAGKPSSNLPACASPVIAAFLCEWNDALLDKDRDRLLPAAVWVPRLVGSQGDEATEERREYLALDWLIRIHTPAWLDLVPSLAPHAVALRALPEVLDTPSVQEAGSVVRAARDAARAAARNAARDAARDAGDAARDAAWHAAGDAAGAAAEASAGDAAWHAAGDAASDAAWGAAWAAAARDIAWPAAADAERHAKRAAAYAAREDAAWAAALGAAGDAARAAARAAALDAALDAAWAAAAWASARASARGAARGAARAAAMSVIRPTVETLQQSALDLLDRMLTCGEHRREEEG